MTAPAYLALYLACGFLLLAWMAYLDRLRARAAFWMSLLWPLVLLMIPVIVALDWLADSRGWCVDLQFRRDLSPFGFRSRPAGGRGWAIRFLWVELQAWAKRGAL